MIKVQNLIQRNRIIVIENYISINYQTLNKSVMECAWVCVCGYRCAMEMCVFIIILYIYIYICVYSVKCVEMIYALSMLKWC